MKILVCGYGRLGQRHAKLLKESGADVRLVSRHGTKDFPCVSHLRESTIHEHQAIVIATETSEHIQSVKFLAEENYRGLVFVEKPIFEKPYQITHQFVGLYTMYNLRFHPLVQLLKQKISTEKVLLARLEVGQYLPDFRPGSDYRNFYSAHRSQGGGVLRDLSHEIDMAQYLLGDLTLKSAVGGKYSDLEIDCEDTYTFLAKAPRCPSVTVHMNYLDRQPTRKYTVTTSQQTYHLDLVANELLVGSEKITDEKKVKDTYGLMAEAILHKKTDLFANEQAAKDVLRIIDECEKMQK